MHQDYISTELSEIYGNALLDHGLLPLDSAIKNADDGFMEFYRLRQLHSGCLHHWGIRFSFKVTICSSPFVAIGLFKLIGLDVKSDPIAKNR